MVMVRDLKRRVDHRLWYRQGRRSRRRNTGRCHRNKSLMEASTARKAEASTYNLAPIQPDRWRWGWLSWILVKWRTRATCDITSPEMGLKMTAGCGDKFRQKVNL